MKRAAKIFIIYFPVILVSCQVMANLLFFFVPEFYRSQGFYLNTFFGTNILFALFLLIFTFCFKFCTISRYAAIAEIAFALNYLIVKNDGLYNILFQVIVGVTSLAITVSHYTNKFPLCKLSLLIGFYKNVLVSSNCSEGFERWQKEVTETINKLHSGKAT